MAAASLVVKVSAQVAEFQKNFAEATRTAQKFERDFANTASSVSAQQKRITDAFSSFSGDRIAREAAAVAKAVEQIGGASKLTAAEQSKVNATVSEAIAKYNALGQQAPKALLDLERATRKVGDATKEVPKQLSLAEKAAGLLGGAFGTFTAAGLATTAITKLTSSLVEFVSKGAQLQGVQTSFERLGKAAGQSTETMLDELQRGTRGLVTNLDLMTSANKAMLLGLPVTSQSMGELAKTATTLGKAMGQDATTSLNDLIVALGRSSPLILDNLGLTVKVGEANEKYAAKLGVTADSLTDVQKKMAFYEAAMEAARKKTIELGDQTLTLSERLSKVWVNVENVVTRRVSDMNLVLGKATESWKQFFQFISDSARFKSWDEMAKKLRPEATTGLPFIDPTALARESKAFQQDIKDAEQAYEELKDKAKKATEERTRNEKENSKIRTENTLREFEETRIAFVSYIEMIRKANDGYVEGLEGLNFRKSTEVNVINGLAGEWLKYRDIIDSVNKMQRLGLDSAPGERIDPLGGPAGDWIKSLNKSGKDAGVAWGQQFSRSIIGAIQGGGDVGKAIGAQLGTSIGEELGKKLAATIGGKLGGILGGALGPLGAIGGSLLGGLADKIFGSAGRDMVKAFASSQGGFDTLQKKIEALGPGSEYLWKNLTQGVGKNNPQQAQAAIDAVTAALGRANTESQKLVPTFSDVTAAADRYGLSITQIGDRINDLRVMEFAQQAVKDWELLASAGADMEQVAAGMADEMQNLVIESGKFGHALPEAMRPILQKMIDMGLLTDDAGEKLTDLTTLHFEKPLTDAIDGLIGKMDQLIDKISSGLGGAIRNIPSDLGLSIPQLASGGIVRSPTLALIGESGPEAVIPLGSGGGFAADDRPIIVNSYIDGRQAAEGIAPHIPHVVKRMG